MSDAISENARDLSRIHEFWEHQALKHRTDLQAVMPDVLLKELELRALRGALDPALDTLEAGCGNGVNLVPLSQDFTGKLTGFDYSDSMISAAKEAASQAGRAIEFHTANVLDDLGFLGTFPQVFTVRCLINLPSLDMQLRAVENLAGCVKAGGRMALLECTQEGLANINAVRKCVDLPAIDNHWHNLYIDEPAFLARVPRSLRHVDTVAFSSLYYLISRVFNAKLTPPGQSPDYLAEINKIAMQLPSVGNFGPHKLFVFEKTA